MKWVALTAIAALAAICCLVGTKLADRNSDQTTLQMRTTSPEDLQRMGFLD